MGDAMQQSPELQERVQRVLDKHKVTAFAVQDIVVKGWQRPRNKVDHRTNEYVTNRGREPARRPTGSSRDQVNRDEL